VSLTRVFSGILKKRLGKGKTGRRRALSSPKRERKGVRGFLTPTTLTQKDYITPILK